ncbi:hypothetical protein M5K25_005637 [Dendrobium thyrsiflorum]|uniref:RRM domain-containing protein n=1 Tax=Dendrobium thyrsiflorum TaxID=117978 RepID=A0ABD0VID4_DENTH
MAAMKFDALEERLEGEMNQIKETVEERMSSVEGQVADLRDMMKKMLEFQTQSAASNAKGPEAKNTNSEIRREEEEVEIVEGRRGRPHLEPFQGRREEEDMGKGKAMEFSCCFPPIWARPHGQHSVVLVEPVPKYLDCRNERNEPRSTASSSHQIYLTFPAESTFTEDDVSNYFKQFGPVRDVRIPCQEKRMFGFVSFVYPETVSKILMKRVPHYISGSRVLVKPYREKSRMVDRIHAEQIKSPIYYPLHCVDFDSEPQALPREFESSSALKMHFEEQDKLLELQRMRLSEFDFAQESLNQQSNFNHVVENLKLPGPDEFTLEDHFKYTLEALNIDFSTDDKTRNTSTSCSNLER